MYALWILGVEAVGALSGFLTRQNVAIYAETITKPPLSPPGIVFPVIWAFLYLLMGIGAARIWLAHSSKARSEGLLFFFIQLTLNFFWSIIFFNLQRFSFAFLWLLAMWAAILYMICMFRKADRPAAWLQVPYLVWVTFAGYLNLGVWLLNRA